jgi:nitroreductase
MAVSSDTLEKSLEWRYATKKFDPSKKIPAEQWRVLERSLQLSPSSFGLQPWKFIVVEDPKIRAALREFSWGQSQIVDASHMVVLCMRKDLNSVDVDRYVNFIADTRGVPAAALTDYKKMMLDFVTRPADAFDVNGWAVRQVYIALGMFLEAAALMEIDACPMEGLVPSKYDEILNLNGTGYGSVVVVTAGYRSPEDSMAKAKKVRYPLNEVIERR